MNDPTARETLVGAIARALRGLRFGSVEITVHEGRVTLIERREKVRVKDEETAPIGRPKDARSREVNPVEEDPTGRPEVPLMERADDATRNLEGSSWNDVDSDDGNGWPDDGNRRRPGSPGAADRGRGAASAASRRGGDGA
ncbi:MAG TPA: YezD family protein [Candidatus Polarisedimenticolia bacterium]|nr:YezD family protein [Candidatus Polarisedimenticolia bacterium]